MVTVVYTPMTPPTLNGSLAALTPTRYANWTQRCSFVRKVLWLCLTVGFRREEDWLGFGDARVVSGVATVLLQRSCNVF